MGACWALLGGHQAPEQGLAFRAQDSADVSKLQVHHDQYCLSWGPPFGTLLAGERTTRCCSAARLARYRQQAISGIALHRGSHAKQVRVRDVGHTCDHLLQQGHESPQMAVVPARPSCQHPRYPRFPCCARARRALRSHSRASPGPRLTEPIPCRLSVAAMFRPTSPSLTRAGAHISCG